MVRWLRIGAAVAAVGMFCTGCAVAPAGTIASPGTDDIVQELRAVRRDLGTLRREQARHAVAFRRSQQPNLREAVARLNRQAYQLSKQLVEQRGARDTASVPVPLDREIAQLRGDVRRLREELEGWRAAQAGHAAEISKNDAERQRQLQGQVLAEVARLTDALDRNNAELKALAGRVAETDQKVSALQQQLTAGQRGSQGGQVPTQAPNKKQNASNTLRSAAKLCASDCSAGRLTSPACHRCTACAELCVRREGGSSAALDACQSYCATR